VELHGGRIWVEEAQGHGACFCFKISKAIRAVQTKNMIETLEAV
jgi:signal transduction histidine kinase